jgi:DNA repair exonuclease SbcCD nuclease subunit
MIKNIFLAADIHIRKNESTHDATREVLENFIESVKTKIGKDDIIICAGDVFDSFCTVTNELELFVSWFLKEMDALAPTIVIAGNHDLLRANVTNRVDSLTPIFKMVNFRQTKYLDMELEYNSGIYEYDEKYAFALFSIHDEYRTPDIQTYKKDNPNKIVIGLFHGALIGSKTPIGFTMNKGVKSDVFEDCDLVLAGDIHMPQTLVLKNNIKFHYSGSLIQGNFGEKINGHGYSVISLHDFEIKHVEVENPHTLYAMEINSIDDIENDKEILTNI